MRNHLIRYLTMLLMLICGLSTSWATDPVTDTFAATGFTPALPTNYQTSASNFTCTSSGNVYSICNAKWNNTCLFISKDSGGGYVESTQSKVVKEIKFTTPSTSIAGAAVVNLYVNGAKKSSWSSMSGNTTYSYSVPTSDQAANTTFKFQASGGNCQILSITYVYDDTDPGTGGTGGGETSSGTDTLTKDNFVASGSSYKDVSYTSPTTGVVYTGKTNAGQQYIQINTTSGWIYANSQDNKVAKSITFTPNSDSQDQTVLVYGSNSELRGTPSTEHTGLVQLLSTSGTTSGTFDLKDSDDNYYKYILVYANKWVRYNAVAFTWDFPGTPEPAALAGKPVFTMDGVELTGDEYVVAAGSVVTITCPDATKIRYEWNDESTTVNAATTTFTINENGILEAWGINADDIEGEESTIITFSLIPDTSVKKPVVTIGGVGQTDNASITVDKGTVLHVTAENANKVRYTIDGGTWISVNNSTHNVILKEEGVYRFYGLDTDNNEGPVFTLTVNFNKPAAPVFSPAAGAVVSGTQLTITCEGAEAIKYKWIEDNTDKEYVYSTCLTIDSPITYTAWGEKTVTVDGTTYIVKGPEATASYTITSGSGGGGGGGTPTGNYKLVTNLSQIGDGSKVIIAAKNSPVAMSTKQNTNNRGQASVTKSDDGNLITAPGADVQILTLEAVAGTNPQQYKFNAGDDGYLYAAGTNKNNYLKTSTNSQSGKENAVITVSDAGVASVTFQGENTNNVLRYNSGSSLFSCYGSSTNQSDIALYVLDSSTGGTTPDPEPVKLEAPTFDKGSQEFTGSITVKVSNPNATGTIYYTTDNSTPTTSSNTIANGGELTFTATTMLKAIVIDGVNTNSDVTEATYTLQVPAGVTLTEPTFSVTTGSVDGDNKFEGSIAVTINNSNGKGTVYYTTDNSDPTTSSTKVAYTAPVEISATTTLKAYVAATAPDTDSPVATVTYIEKETVTPPAGDSTVDHLTLSVLGVTDGNKYTDFSVSKDDPRAQGEIKSSAGYAGKAIKHADGVFRLNTGANNIHNTSADGYITNIKVKWDSSTTTDRIFRIYIVDEATSEKTGEPDVKLKYDGTNEYSEYSFPENSNVEYVVLTGNNAIMLTDIWITWEQPSVTKPKAPTFSPASGAKLYADGTTPNNTVTIKSVNATKIFYTINDGVERSAEANSEGEITVTLTTAGNVTLAAYGKNETTNETGTRATATYKVVYHPTAPTFSNESGLTDYTREDYTVRKGTVVKINTENGNKLTYSVAIGSEYQTYTKVDAPATVTITDDAMISAKAVNDDDDQSEEVSKYFFILKPTIGVTFDPEGSSSLNWGDFVTVTCLDNNVDQVRYTITDEESAIHEYPVVDVDPTTHTATIPVKVQGLVALTVYPMVSGAEGAEDTVGEVYYEVAAPQLEYFGLISDNVQLEEDVRYLIVSSPSSNTASKYAMGKIASGKAGAEEVEVVDDVISANKASNAYDNMVFAMLEKQGDKWAIKLQDGDNNSLGYLAANPSTLTVSYADESTADNNTLADINIGSNKNASIHYGENNDLYYRNGVFKNYGSVQTALRLYAEIDVNQVRQPIVKAATKPDADGYYNNAVTLTPSTVTEDATYEYSTNYDAANPDDATWTTVPAKWSVNAPGTYVVRALKEDLTTSKVSVPLTLNFRPAAPVIDVNNSLVVSKNVVIKPSATEGAVTSWRYAGTEDWETVSESTAIYLTEQGSVTFEAKAYKADYNPDTVVTTENVTIEYDGSEAQTYTYDSGILNKEWKNNDTDATIKGVTWHLLVTNKGGGTDDHNTYLSASNGSLQIGSNDNPAKSAVISTSQIPGTISKIVVYPSASSAASGGTLSVKVNGADYGNPASLTYGTAVQPLVFEGNAIGDIVLNFVNTNNGGLYIESIKVDYTPVIYDDMVRTPRFSIPSGSYLDGTQVSISCATEDAEIRYTLDGSDPTEMSPVYTAPIKLEVVGENDEEYTDYTIKACAFKNGLIASYPISGDYRAEIGEVYQLVTTGTELSESDRLILVNAVPFPYICKDQDYRYYAMTRQQGGSSDYWNAVGVVPKPDEPNKLLVHESQNVMVMKLQRDGSGANADRPWLIMTDMTDEEGEALFLESVKERELSLRTLPEAMEDRGRMNAKVNISDVDYDFVEYSPNGSSFSSPTNSNHTILHNKAVIVFSGKDASDKQILTTMRFNPNGNYIHFNGFGYKEDNGQSQLNGTTWPVSVYRSVDRLYRPSITVYSQKVNLDNYNDAPEYETDPLGESVVSFYNPVKIVVAENPRSDANAVLKYHWAKNATAVPVSTEYTPISGSGETRGAEMVVYLDGFNLKYTDVGGVDRVVDLRSPEQDIDLESNEVMRAALFAMSTLGETDSPNTHRVVGFKTTPPVLTKVEGTNNVKISRPEIFTKGAKMFYTLNGSVPAVVWTNGVPAPANENVVGPITLSTDPDAEPFVVTVDDGKTLRVGAFKEGYETSVAMFGNLTVNPYVRPIQLLELEADGLNYIKQKSTPATRAEINSLDSEKKIYLTYRPFSVNSTDNPKFYVLQYTTNTSDRLTAINIIDVDNDAAKYVINYPHWFKWTADYYVYGMRLDEFETTVKDYKNAEMYIHDGTGSARVIATTFNLNEDDEKDAPENVRYYGSVLRRKGALGTNYLWTEFKYEAKLPSETEDKYQRYETQSVTSVTPVVPAPFELRYHYESVRDESSLYDREDDYVFVDDTYSSIPGIVTAMKNGMEKNTLKFRKEDFTLRHLNCVFTFHRPNVCDDIIDNYDIVYDVQVKTGEGLPNPRDKYVDPTKAADIKKIEADALAAAQAAGETLTEEKIHDIVNRYEFRVNNVHPDSDIFPTLVIHGVNYYPNGENEGYSELNANYTGDESKAMDEFYGVVDLDGKTVQEVQAPNLSGAAEMTVYVEVAYDLEKDAFGAATGKYNWEIAGHTEVRNGDVHAHDNTPVVAPFMYHIEGAYFENKGDEEKEDVTPEKYFSYEYLICHEAGTDPEGCGTQGVEGEDPFFKIPVGNGYDVGKVPTIFITPMYFFERMPEPSVTEESALVEYDIHYADNNKTNAPKKVMRRAGESDADNPDVDQPQIIVVRGKNAYSKRAENSVMTGIDGMGTEGIVQQGNNLILPQGAKLYDTSGLQMRPEGLPHGIYLVRLADGRTVKVAVK